MAEGNVANINAVETWKHLLEGLKAEVFNVVNYRPSGVDRPSEIAAQGIV
jgi:hypothetical protein